MRKGVWLGSDRLPHLQYPGLPELVRQPHPESIARCVEWILSHAVESAVDNFPWYGPGFHGLVVGLKTLGRSVVESVQINVYKGEYPGNDGKHGHGRIAETLCMLPDGAAQITQVLRPLPSGTSLVQGIPVEEVAVVGNILRDGEGGKPAYNIVPLGAGLVAVSSRIEAVNGTRRQFASFEPHSIDMRFRRDRQVGVYWHWKGA